MNLSVIVPVFNRKETTLSFLKQIYDQSYQNHYEVIVIDDGSRDGTDKAIQSNFPKVKLLKGNGNWWWSKSVNEGIKYAVQNGSDTILLMNDDIIFESDYLDKLLKNYDSQSIRGTLTVTSDPIPRVFFSGIKDRNKFTGAETYYYKKFSHYDKSITGLKPSYGLPGRGLLIPAWVFDKIGLFDELKLPQYKADTDFALRAIKKNITVNISWDAIIYTQVEQTGNGSLFKDQPLKTFLKSYFNIYSHNSIKANYSFNRKHVPWYMLPYVMLYATLGGFILFSIKKAFKLYRY